MRPAARWHHNLGLKLLSLTLALLLWFYVHGIKVVEREMVVPVRAVGLPDSLMLLSDPPATARVLVSGQAQELIFRRFVPGAELRLDFSHARPPIVRFEPTVEDVHLGAQERLTLQSIVQPEALELRLDRRVRRMLPVRIVTAGVPAAGQALQGGLRATPATVLCTGAASRLAGLHDIPTQAVDLTGKHGEVRQRVGLDTDPNRIRCEPEQVTVEARLSPAH